MLPRRLEGVSGREQSQLKRIWVRVDLKACDPCCPCPWGSILSFSMWVISPLKSSQTPLSGEMLRLLASNFSEQPYYHPCGSGISTVNNRYPQGIEGFTELFSEILGQICRHPIRPRCSCAFKFRVCFHNVCSTLFDITEGLIPFLHTEMLSSVTVTDCPYWPRTANTLSYCLLSASATKWSKMRGYD